MILWATLAIAALPMQADSSGRRTPRPRLGVAIAGMHVAQRVPAVSPSRYTGLGVTFALSYGRSAADSYSEIGLAITYAKLTSTSDSLVPPWDRIGIAALTVTHLRRARSLSSTHVSTLLGLRLEALGSLDVHDYGTSYPSPKDAFDYVALTLAPAVRLTFPIGSGHVDQQLSIPLLGLADFPYVNGRAQRGLHLRAVTIPELLALDERLSWRSDAFRRGWGLAWSYHLAILRHARYDTRRYARQGVSATLSIPIGKHRS